MRVKLKYFFFIIISIVAFLRSTAQRSSILYKPFRTHLQKGTIQDFLDEIKAVERNDKIILTPSLTPIEADALLPLYSFFGIVSEDGSREPLTNAVVYEPATMKAVLCNTHGYFTIQLPEGYHRLEISYAGHIAKLQDISLHWDLRGDIALARKEDIPAVIISGDNGLRKNATEKIVPGHYDAYNNFMGENDDMRSLYIFPGVMSVSDAAAGLLIRGGEQDGNLFLLDGNPVFNPTHMLGALSIVNSTSLRSIQLFRNDFPSRYGGRLSAVIDVNTKDGNMETWGGQANMNFLAGSFTIEGPLKKNRTAMMLSFRHSMPNAVLNLFQKDLHNSFYDLQFKCTHLLDKNNKLMFNVYTGIDNLNLSISNNNLNNRQRWGNRIASLGWTHILSPKAFVTTTLSTSNYYNIAGYIYTSYDDSTGEVLNRRSFNTYSSLSNYAARTQVEMRMTNTVKLNFGGGFAYTKIKPFESKVDTSIEIDPSAFQSFTPLPFRETTLYAELEARMTKNFLIRPGIHFSGYRFRDYRYASLQPRIYAVYKVHRYGQVYASYSRMTQYLHLLTNPSLGINSDTWVPSTGQLGPENARMIDLGYMFKGEKNLSFTVAGYWKSMDKVTNYTEGKSFFINTDSTWEQHVETGKGWSYGLEFMGDKTGDRLSLHIAYTLSWNWRQFEMINQGRKFPFKYDRRHNLSIAATYKADKTKDISLLWTIASGDVYSLPERIYPDYDNVGQIYSPDDLLKDYRFIYHFSGVNAYRTSPYHRLDLSASWRPPHRRRLGISWKAGVYNVYGAPGQYSYGLEGTLRSKSMVIIMKNQLLNITPYISTTIDF